MTPQVAPSDLLTVGWLVVVEVLTRQGDLVVLLLSRLLVLVLQQTWFPPQVREREWRLGHLPRNSHWPK